MHDIDACIGFGARRVDLMIGAEILLVVEPLAVEAALMAEVEAVVQLDERRRALELERQQAEYEAKLAARRHEKVDPDNRLVAAELEARWNAAMTRLRACEAKLVAADSTPGASAVVSRESLLDLAKDLDAPLLCFRFVPAPWHVAPPRPELSGHDERGHDAVHRTATKFLA